jgi:chorismate dehydratase
VEYFRTTGCTIVSDACVACRGPVLSVKLYFRVPPAEVRRVALDEGSRTSAALTQILLAELCDVRPQWESLPIGCGLDSTDADAVLLIGDRAIGSEVRGVRTEEQGAWNRNQRGEPLKYRVLSTQYEVPAEPRSSFHDVWDLGERWNQWTGLPFVFAMWIARPAIDTAEIAEVITAARDQGVRNLQQIADREAPALEISGQLASMYLRDNLHFALGPKEREGLRHFYRLCVGHQLAPPGRESQLDEIADGCPAK